MKTILDSDWLRARQLYYLKFALQCKLFFFMNIILKLVIIQFLVQFGIICTSVFFKELKLDSPYMVSMGVVCVGQVWIAHRPEILKIWITIVHIVACLVLQRVLDLNNKGFSVQWYTERATYKLKRLKFWPSMVNYFFMSKVC